MAKEVGGEFIRTAKEMEDMKVTFESLYTTAAEGEQKFNWLVNFSRANPVMGIEAAKEAFLSLKNNGVEPTAAAMKAMGDTMAAMPGIGNMLGKDVGELLEGRYMTGGAFAQAGIKLHKTSKGGNTSYEGSYQNREGVKIPVKLDINDANKTIEQLTKILDDRFGGTMEKHAKTMTGLIARWGNDWQNFQMQIMDNHVFAQLEDELFDLITQWEAWAKSPDAHEMLSGVSQILTLIVKIIGEAIRLMGEVAEKFSKWFGTTSGIAILLGTMFVASKWTSIIGLVVKLGGAFKDVYAALQLVAEGEGLVTVMGALMDGVLSPLNLIVVALVAAGAGIAYMVKQWRDFQNGILGEGIMGTFLQGLEHMLVSIRSFFEYMFDSLRIKALEAQAYLSRFHVMDKLTGDDQKELDNLRSQHTLGIGGYMEQQERIADTPRHWMEDIHTRGTEMHKKHPEWSKEKIWGVLRRENLSSSADILSGDISSITSKSYVAPAPAPKKQEASSQYIQKYAQNEITLMGPVTVHANSPESFAEQMADSSKSLIHTQANLTNGGKKY
ncbi:hypothetical protein ACQPT2_04280 [Erwinia amylovora]